MQRNLIGGALVFLALLLPVSAMAEPVFHLDTPADGSTVAGFVEVRGWILDDGQSCGPPEEWQLCDWTDALISSIDLYVDGVFVASADLNVPRYDVLRAYPWYAGTPFAHPGFSTSFNADTLTDGEHTILLRVRFSDKPSDYYDYGTRTVIVDRSLNQAPFGELEKPGDYQPMNGVFPVTGWALDDGSIQDIEVMIDGEVVPGTANYGVHRPDIGNRFPSHPGSDYAGFVHMVNTSKIINGVHVLSVRLRDNQQATRIIGRRYVTVTNVGYNLPPFGGIDWPIANHTMFTTACTLPPNVSLPPYKDPDNVELISGWALDIGSSTDRGGVAWVELEVDGKLMYNTRTDAFYYPYFGMDVNYYGLERLDIEKMFEDVPNSKHCGWAFALDIGDLIVNHGFHDGLHYIKIRAGDEDGNVADIAEIPVIFDCNDDPDRPAWGDIETPTNMERVSGVTEVAGWAMDYEWVTSVEVWVDGEFIDYANFPEETPGLQDQYPWFPHIFTDDAGFSYDLDTTKLPDGEHALVIRTKDYYRGETIIGERHFVVDNLN